MSYYYYHRARHPGVTMYSLRAMLRHLHKVGKPHTVEAYSMNTRRRSEWEDGWLSTWQTFVRVRGDLGTIRFGGFSWGYGGEGPHGLKELFHRLDIAHINPDPIEWKHEWKGRAPSTKLYQPAWHWRIDLTAEVPEVVWLEEDKDWERNRNGKD